MSETWDWRDGKVTLVYVVREDGSESYAIWRGSELAAMENNRDWAVARFIGEVKR